MIEFNFDWGAVLTYLTVFIIACFGGIVDFLEKLHKAKVKPPMKTVLFNLLVKVAIIGKTNIERANADF